MSLFFDWIPAKSSGKMKAAKTKPKVKMIKALAWVTCTKLEEPIGYQLYQLYSWRTSSPAPRGAGFLPSSLLSATDLFGNMFRLEIRSIGPFTPIFLDTSKLNSVLHIPLYGGLLALFFPDIPDQLQRTGKTWTSCWAGRLFLILWPEAWWYGDGIGFVLGKGKPKVVLWSRFIYFQYQNRTLWLHLTWRISRLLLRSPWNFSHLCPTPRRTCMTGSNWIPSDGPQTTQSCF